MTATAELLPLRLEDTAAGEGGGPATAVSLALRPHQQAAFTEAMRHLGEHDRVTVALPCGTGKTLLGQRLAQYLGRHGRSAILVLVPSVALLAQTMRAWVRHSARPLAVFVLCHDRSVSSTDLHVPVSTSAAALAGWVTREQQQIRRPTDPQVVVFATYQSSPRIAEAHRDHGLAPWHVVVADEAHCAAGQFEAAFATVVHDSKVPAAVRIFLTATPRIRGRSAGALCMDDPGAFGPVVAPLAVRAAIDARLLSDYVVAVVTVTDAEVRAAIGPLQPINIGGRVVSTDQVATQLAVASAARTYGLRRTMVFHNSVEASRRFSGGLADTLAQAGDELADRVVAMHIDGTTSARRRAECLAVLAEPGGDRWAVLSNVRCLGVGVDVPALDGVVFASPRSSQIDIIQSVGRALRVDPSRPEPAVIVLPVFLEAGGPDVAQQVASSSFRHVYRTLLALADQDAELVAELRRGARRRRHTPDCSHGGGHVGGGRLEVVDVGGGLAADAVLAALQVETLRLLSPGWDFGLEQLHAYAEEHGHTRVPASYVTESGYPLGAWVRGQRRRRGQLTGERIAALDSTPGWVWNLHEAAWADAFDKLAGFAGEHGHTRIPRDHRCYDGFLLFQWASDQRREYAAGTLDAQRTAALESLPGWQWRPAGQRWEYGFAQLAEFAADTGQASPSQNYVTEQGYRLGEWVSKQRYAHARGQLDAQRTAALESLPGWQWDLLEARWCAGLAELARFAAQHGHLGVPRNYRTAGGDPLGKWVDNQRSAERAGTLAAHRVAALEALPGWSWSAPAAPGLKGAPR
ncbi:DEAD/DEAH box helicase [Mycobacterium kyorinense]|uniref:DEAD/DEAH box helicase n=1 Tax=Mycobacterium kyorinense TaxID=487514 RepID=UPI000704C5F4|nr:DEAD/DEAH box helicase [Mycobacterium kyorinense]